MKYNNQTFFDKASTFYDSMINIENAINRKVELFNKLKVSYERAADLGCGSGADAIALSQNGCSVDAFDPSSQMIESAKINSTIHKSHINFYNYALENIPDSFNNKYTFASSLGNTLPNIDPKNLLTALSNSFKILKDNGRLIIQILNYELVLKKHERIVNITEKNGFFFVRFYDFKDDYLVFNILKFSKDNPKDKILISTDLFPYTFNQISELLNSLDFKSVNYFGDNELNSFDKTSSKDLIIFLEK